MTVSISRHWAGALALRRTLLGVFLAIAITSAMDATGFSAFSALPLYGPEVGVLGLALNVLFVVILWRWFKVHSR